jgi:hypothetical protein
MIRKDNAEVEIVAIIITIGIVITALLVSIDYQHDIAEIASKTILQTPTVPVPDVPVVAPTSVPGEQTVLSYTLRGEDYWMIVPLNSQLETYYAYYPPIYACTRNGNDNLPCTRPELEKYYQTYVGTSNGLQSIVTTIRGATNNTDDQARIAISIVQHIPYDAEKVNMIQVGSNTNRSRLPYQVIYENMGVCSEKAGVLAYLLKELGYGVALFEFRSEKHMVVGIRAPEQYAYKNTGYAFIETTIPSVITDSNGIYTGIGNLQSYPIVYRISEGKSMDSIGEEFADGARMQELARFGAALPFKEYHEWQIITKKYGITYT